MCYRYVLVFDQTYHFNGWLSLFFSTDKAKPQEIEHHFSVRFPGIQCKNIGSHDELRLAIEKEISDTLTIIPGCEACQLKTLTVPGCDLAPYRKSKRSVDNSVKIQFLLVVKEAVNVSSSMDSVDEKSEALLFQMQYVVAAGKFMINLNGNNFTADRSSFEHISSSITCGAGYVQTKSGKECGRHYSLSFLLLLTTFCQNLRDTQRRTQKNCSSYLKLPINKMASFLSQ